MQSGVTRLPATAASKLELPGPGPGLRATLTPAGPGLPSQGPENPSDQEGAGGAAGPGPVLHQPPGDAADIGGQAHAHCMHTMHTMHTFQKLARPPKKKLLSFDPGRGRME